jgi:hypothetical protein
MLGFAHVFVLRPADTQRQQWFDEKIDLSRDWRAAFKASAVPPVLEILIGGDVDDTKVRLDARIDRIRFGPC